MPTRPATKLPVVPVSVVSVPSETASPKLCAPVVVTVPPLMFVPPRASVVRLAMETAPPNVVAPVVLTVSACAPVTVPSNAIAPVVVLISVTSVPSVTGSL